MSKFDLINPVPATVRHLPGKKKHGDNMDMMMMMMMTFIQEVRSMTSNEF